MELFTALNAFKARRFEDCAEICTKLLKDNPLDEAVWVLKMRALTLQVYVDDLEGEEETIESILDDNAIAQKPRPGTSLKNPGTATVGGGLRPKTQAGRPITGMIRPMTRSGTAQTVEQALRTARTETSRPINTASGRVVRLGTASMISDPDGAFIELSRLNIPKYAKRPELAKPLFEYIFYHEHDPRMALDLAIQSDQASNHEDWFWKIQQGKCYYMLGLIRDAEQFYRSALKQQKSIELVLRLTRIYVRLDQPLAAINLCNSGLEYYPKDTSILCAMARVYEGLNNSTMSLKSYKIVIEEDPSNVEAIASLAMHHFYTDQPELALKLYRRIFQLGLYNAEILTNLGLSCFYSHQYDHSNHCFLRALKCLSDDTAADVWYNISHIAICRGDLTMAEECLQIAIFYDNTHALSYNNLGVLQVRKGNLVEAGTYFNAAAAMAEFMYEPHFNSAFLAYNSGDLQSSYLAVKKSLRAYPDHFDSKELLEKIEPYFRE